MGLMGNCIFGKMTLGNIDMKRCGND